MIPAHEIGDSEFTRISALVYDVCRINLGANRKIAVQNRLSKHMRTLNLRNFSDYLSLVESDESHLSDMIDCICNNYTSFFRERAHFDFVRKKLIPQYIRSGKEKIRVWSAACSSGEEPYSLAILFNEYLLERHETDCLILASDISVRMLIHARKRMYREKDVEGIPGEILDKYFRMIDTEDGELYRVRGAAARLVRLKHINLFGHWPIKGGLDLIFCRNALIYFDRQHQAEAVRRFYDVLAPGGILVVGHSESLEGLGAGFERVQPSIYRKPV